MCLRLNAEERNQARAHNVASLAELTATLCTAALNPQKVKDQW